MMSETTVHDESRSASFKEKIREADLEGEIVAAGGELEVAVREDNEKLEREQESDPYLVTWKGSDDPENPLNFTTTRKIVLLAMIAALAFLTYFIPHRAINKFRPTASAMFSPAIPNVMEEFHETSEVLGSFSVSMFILGYAIGPLSAHPSQNLN